jgi:plastocyanin/mono/diheme cytochrome c family protein
MSGPSQDRPGGGSEPRGDEQRLPARRPSSEPIPSRASDRFTAPRSVRAVGGLTPERAAKIVRQSGDARWVAFLGVAIVALFVIVYYFYELGAPAGLSTPRLEAQGDVQQVQTIERGYNLYEANCARCHGVNGEGGIGPVLNDQMKLYSHLTASYVRTVLNVGGRYVCGNSKSLMPIWADVNGGPLNYIQIESLIAFLRAPNTQEFIVRDPQLNEPVLGADGKVKTFKGWLDPEFKPPADASPVPDCYLGTAGGATPAPAESLPADATILEISASQIAFDKKELEAPAGSPFGIHFVNNDAGIEHDVDIRLTDGTVLVDNARIQQGEITYTIKALDAGTYTFICSVHPIPAMTGTLTVK